MIFLLNMAILFSVIFLLNIANLCHLYIFHEKSRSEFGEISPKTPKKQKQNWRKEPKRVSCARAKVPHRNTKNTLWQCRLQTCRARTRRRRRRRDERWRKERKRARERERTHTRRSELCIAQTREQQVVTT